MRSFPSLGNWFHSIIYYCDLQREFQNINNL